VKQTWTEHQDDELKTLFEEFYQLPQDTAAEYGLLLFISVLSYHLVLPRQALTQFVCQFVLC